MELRYDNKRTRAGYSVIEGTADVERKSPLELFEELYNVQNNQAMSEEQRRFTKELIELIQEGK